MYAFMFEPFPGIALSASWARSYTSGSGRKVLAVLRWTPAGMKESSHSGLPRSREDATVSGVPLSRSTDSGGTTVLLHQHPQTKSAPAQGLHSLARA